MRISRQIDKREYSNGLHNIYFKLVELSLFSTKALSKLLFFPHPAEHTGIFNLTGKRLRNVKQSAISDHLLYCSCALNLDDFSILATNCNKFKMLLRESLLIKREKSILNRTIKSFPLELFDLDDSFISNITWSSVFILICSNNFILCTDRARSFEFLTVD